MLGLMDLSIDRVTGQAEITEVLFDQPGSKVDVDGSIKRRKKVEEKEEREPPFR